MSVNKLLKTKGTNYAKDLGTIEAIKPLLSFKNVIIG